jgi:hypothetical protein
VAGAVDSKVVAVQVAQVVVAQVGLAYREPQELQTQVVAVEVVGTPVAPETKKVAVLVALAL